MAKRLAIFDLDGTLLNTIGDLAACCNHMLAQRNLPQHSYDDYCHFVGNGVTRLVERALPVELRSAEYVTAARKDFVAHYTENIDTHTVPYNGIVELLDRLATEGVTFAVASNKFHEGTVKLVNKFFGNYNFEAVHGNREGFPLKPDAAILTMIMEQCGTTPENTCMIGDSGVDIVTAKAAGVRSIGVTWGFRPREELAESGADTIVDTPTELFDAIME